MVNTLGLNPSDASLVGSSPIPGTTPLRGMRALLILIDDYMENIMSIPTPHEPDDYDFKPINPSAPDKPNLKDFDDESNWLQSTTNPSIQINRITGKMRTKDFINPENYPKSI